MPQLLILQPLLWVVPLITTSSRPRLSSAFRFNRRQGAAGAGNSPSVSEGVAEGRGSNMSVKIPCVWLAALAQNGLAARAFYVTQKSRKSQKITRFARKGARCASWGVVPEEDSLGYCFLRAIGGNFFFCDKDTKIFNYLFVKSLYCFLIISDSL